MPILEPTKSSAPLFYPQTDYLVARYMDLTKFLSMLSRKQVFFCRLDNFEDPLEGTTSKANRKFREEWYRRASPKNLLDEDVSTMISDYDEHTKMFKALINIGAGLVA